MWTWSDREYRHLERRLRSPWRHAAHALARYLSLLTLALVVR